MPPFFHPSIYNRASIINATLKYRERWTEAQNCTIDKNNFLYRDPDRLVHERDEQEHSFLERNYENSTRDMTKH